jgi:ABC-type sugar transport system permease subunit
VAGATTVDAGAAADRGPPPQIRRRSAWRRRETLVGYAFLAPSLFFVLVFVVYLVTRSAYISFFEWDLFTDPNFIGLDNYRAMVDDELLRTSIVRTFYYAALSIPASIILGLGLALAVNRQLRGITFFRTFYFLPVVTPVAATAVIWRWLYNPEFGILNWFIGLFSLGPVNWLGDPDWAMPSVVVMGVWAGLGLDMTIFLIGLQSIPRDLYEAAEVDGAGRWARLRYITWPLVSPFTFFVLVTATIGSFQVFTEAYFLTDGGPERATYFYNWHLWREGFEFFNMGYAAAMAWLLFAFVGLVTVLQFRFINRRVHYGHDQ